MHSTRPPALCAEEALDEKLKIKQLGALSWGNGNPRNCILLTLGIRRQMLLITTEICLGHTFPAGKHISL